MVKPLILSPIASMACSCAFSIAAANMANSIMHAQTIRTAETGQTDLLQKSTVAYRRVAGHQIEADVYRSGTVAPRPVIVWIHGGGLIMGGRESVPPQIRSLAESEDYAIVSIDYRLAPESKLPEIISDVESAFRWIGDEGARQFRLDAQRIVVVGGSAGGYLTLVTGYRSLPRPKALVALYGYGDLTGAWYATASPHPRHNAKKIPREEADQQTDGTILSNAKQRKGNGSIIYMYYRQNGLWPQMVSGFQPATLADKIAQFEPLRNVSASYPPTMLIHGDKDTDVPYEQSTLMAKELLRHGVLVVLKTIENGEHGFGGGKPEQIDEAYKSMREFITQRLGP